MYAKLFDPCQLFCSDHTLFILCMSVIQHLLGEIINIRSNKPHHLDHN